ncbi:type II secretion system F family protein [candidate division KSB1 bacterium]|nr:type II secretion system F family protein [candidate division KSB1 bacterium]
MPIFAYKAINPNGSVIEDTLEAATAGAAADKLKSIGYHPLKIKSKGGGLNADIFSNKPKVKPEDVIVFTRQLVVLLKAGVPLLSCLDALAEQAENETMRENIMQIYVDIESGISFSEALSKHPDAFEKMYINTIRAGEMGGALDKVLARLAELMEFDRETKAQIKAAMRHPIIIVVSLVVAFISLMLFVVPKFIDMFSKLGVDLPLPTKLLIGMYSVISGYWYILLSVLSVLIIAFKFWVKTPSGAYNWDLVKLKMPIFGSLIMKSTMSRFTRMLETLNSSGLPILQALDIVSKTVGNEVIGNEIVRAAQGVRKGDGLAVPLRQSKLFPPMVIRMISIGEQSGSLDEMLLNISSHYDVEVDYAVKSLSSMIEPIITVMLGIIVLFLALAIFLPMWNLTSIAG